MVKVGTRVENFTLPATGDQDLSLQDFSDRKLVKLYKLFRIRSWIFSGGTVTRDDLCLLSFLGETPEEMALLRDKVPTLLGQ